MQHSVYEGDLKEKIFSDVLHRSWIIVYTALYVDSDEHHTFDIVTQAAVLYDLAKDVKLQPTPFPHISIDVRQKDVVSYLMILFMLISLYFCITFLSVRAYFQCNI